ncbi:adenylosuccinate lyase [Winogradskyella sp. PC-19]|uniref:adenylosuccinate lyase n=1 Tax=unclassified Winogradskyella TaxID=2615021 RepID=UPI000B3BF077|nr:MULTISPECIES: adenylosuccinate lyase [unclassified Winogradskyella]ARV08858.1 adenylosuccinate lyase [Winogradskyella sp. PC-19]RZN79917.1 MAG: adenylosuccinate lyase [Winogradskyella sp.]
MTKDQLYTELNYVNHSREKRLYYANLVIDNTYLISPLLEILFSVNDKISCRAAWVFEFMCTEKLEKIIPFLDIFINNISKVHLDSAVRPVAKICELLCTTYYGKDNSEIKNHLNIMHREKITEACFDWMINEEKVAPKAYGMNALYLLGLEFDWIHPELQIILERDFSLQSAAFKARARHILKKLNKKKS